MGQGVVYSGGTGMSQWDSDILVGLGHSSGTGNRIPWWDWDTAGTGTLALGHFSSTEIPWWHRDTPMGLKYTLVRLGHYRGTLSGIGTLSLVYLGGIGLHCRGTHRWHWDTPVGLGLLSGTGTPWCDLRHPGETVTLTLGHCVGLGISWWHWDTLGGLGHPGGTRTQGLEHSPVGLETPLSPHRCHHELHAGQHCVSPGALPPWPP